MAEVFLITEVMTAEQVEELRKQIVAYAVISESLLATYRTIASQHLSRHGALSFSSIHHTVAESPRGNPSKTPGGPKPSKGRRQIITPTQKKILKDIYDSGKRYPSKEDVRRITFEVAQHGEITEASVYNWFQNRRKWEKWKGADELVGNSKSEAKPRVDESSSRENFVVKKTEFDYQFCSADAPFFQTTEVSPAGVRCISRPRVQRMNPSLSKLNTSS